MSDKIYITKYQFWFGQYARSFLKGSADKVSAIGLKFVHSQKVRQEVSAIGQEIGLSGRDLFLAEIAGLFHDIGRLEQFERFHTFVDAESVDHAQLSIDVIKKEGVLNDLSKEERMVISDAIKYHNKLAVPKEFSGIKDTVAKLVRDADKLDIWRVFDEFYKSNRGCDAINLGLSESNCVSPGVLNDFLAEQVVRYNNVKNQTDFMIMRLSWLFDINFSLTLERMVRRGYIKTIVNMIPDQYQKIMILEKLNSFLKNIYLCKNKS